MVIVERLKFKVGFVCYRTKKEYSIDFSCDDGNFKDKLDFTVNALELTSRGIHAKKKGREIPIWSILKDIIDRKTEWCIPENWHISFIGRCLKLQSSYSLFGCPLITPSSFCPMLQDSSPWCLIFRDCDCSDSDGNKVEVCISIQGLIGMIESEKRMSRQMVSFKRPFCRGDFSTIICKEEIKKPKRFDLGDGTFSPPEELRRLQTSVLSYARVVMKEPEQESEVGALIRRLYILSKVPDNGEQPRQRMEDPIFSSESVRGIDGNMSQVSP